MSTAEEKRAYKAVVERSKCKCEGRTVVCTGRASHIHHKRLRSQGGKTEESNLLNLCMECHQWAHGHPKEASELGLIISRKYA